MTSEANPLAFRKRVLPVYSVRLTADGQSTTTFHFGKTRKNKHSAIASDCGSRIGVRIVIPHNEILEGWLRPGSPFRIGMAILEVCRNQKIPVSSRAFTRNHAASLIGGGLCTTYMIRPNNHPGSDRQVIPANEMSVADA